MATCRCLKGILKPTRKKEKDLCRESQKCLSKSLQIVMLMVRQKWQSNTPKADTLEILQILIQTSVGSRSYRRVDK